MSEEIGYIGNGVYIAYGSQGYEIWFKDTNRKYIFSYGQGYEPYGPTDPEDEYIAMIEKLEQWAEGSLDPQRKDAKRALYALKHRDEYEREREREREHQDEHETPMEEDDEPISIELITN